MKILTWFTENYPELIKEMKICSHNLSETNLSEYHAEGSIWTHTMMVYSQLPVDASVELKLAALLHDIGKPFCAVIREGKGRVSFTGHETYTSFKAIDIVNHFEEDSDFFIDKEIILFAINWHDILHKIVKSKDGIVYIEDFDKRTLNNMFSLDLNLFSFLFKLGFADMKGRISKDINLSVSKYDLLSTYIPYNGDFIQKNKEMTVHMLIGLPGSGKTTTAKKLLIEDPDLVYLSIDDEIMKLNKYSLTYNGAWSKERQKEASSVVFAKMKVCIENKESFILDGANFLEKVRRRQLNAIPTKYYNKIAHLHLAGRKTIEKVMKERKDKNVSLCVIDNMAKEFLYPDLSMFDKINTFIR